MRIAVVGTGISGLVAARELSRHHDVEVFEAEPRLGGHTHTHDIEVPGRADPLVIDTGFIVFNDRTYPNFRRLLDELGVAEQASDMSFSVHNEATGLEYNGTSLNTLFAQRRNLVRPRFWGMVRDILRFYREAPAVLKNPDRDLTLGRFLAEGRYGRTFIEDHLVPMGAAVWSARPEALWDFPMEFLVRFFDNHGFLQVDERPQWKVIAGGSRSYIEPLTRSFADRIRLSTPVVELRRVTTHDGDELVRLRTATGQMAIFDRVVLACHADTALRMLSDVTPLERFVLQAFPFQENVAVLHTDRALLPKRPLARASWNYHVTKPASECSTVTYWMNLLQGFEAEQDYMVTLNRQDEIDPSKVLRTITYQHPIFTRESIAAQARHTEIDGSSGVHFCGAYWGYGFHEDGVRSGLAVARNVARSAGTEAPELLEVRDPAGASQGLQMDTMSNHRGRA